MDFTSASWAKHVGLQLPQTKLLSLKEKVGNLIFLQDDELVFITCDNLGKATVSLAAELAETFAALFHNQEAEIQKYPPQEGQC